MCSSILKDKSRVNDRIASLRALLTGFVEGFTDSSDKLRRNTSSYNFIYKLISSSIAMGINWLDISDDSCILSSTTRLFLMEIIEAMPLSDSFSIVDSWLTRLTVYSELSLYSFDVYLKMQLSHATDDHLL